MVEATHQKAPLEDLMVAMDVVDTLRHQQGIAERELNSEQRRDEMLVRLREIYQAQGIDVSDQMLQEGIAALEQERFQYRPVTPSWQTRLAHVWVSRGRWSKPLGFLTLLGGLFYGVYFATDVWPERQLKANLPTQVQTALMAISQSAKDPQVVEQAKLSAGNARRAISDGNYSRAQAVVENMESVQAQLQLAYNIRVVSRVNENSGIWRRPPGNSQARNYYLIVEAINDNNEVVELTILNQENNRAARKKSWGLRVNEETFYKIAADKKDDGIIQDNKVGRKAVGYLKPVFSIPTTGATITEW